jgi:hypothetical protein
MSPMIRNGLAAATMMGEFCTFQAQILRSHPLKPSITFMCLVKFFKREAIRSTFVVFFVWKLFDFGLICVSRALISTCWAFDSQVTWRIKLIKDDEDMCFIKEISYPNISYQYWSFGC